MEKLTIKEAARYLLGHDNYLILTHRRPDGDTAGCAALLCRALRQVGKTANILENPQLTARYQPLHQGLTVETVPQGARLVAVDIAGREMMMPGMNDAQINLLLDHHGSNTGFAHRGVVDETAAACGELVYELTRELGVELDPEMARALYVALSTDTGCFRYSNTTARTLRTAARCLEAGLDPYPVVRELFETVSFARLRLNAWMTEHLELLEDGKIALCLLPLEVEQALGITEEDTEDLSNFARRIQGVELALTFRTAGSGVTKLSARGIPGRDCAALCVALGGGGHKAAAGATMAMTQQEARAKVLELLGIRN